MTSDAAKHTFVCARAEEGGYTTIVETGLRPEGGVTTEVADRFVTFAIDSSPENVLAARDKGVDALLGDSGEVLPQLLERLDGPACFWLDAHWVVEDGRESSCPLLAELDALLAWKHAPRSLVLIDNLDCFGREGWPTVEEVRIKVDPVWERRERESLNDIMELFPLEGVSRHR